MVKWSRHRPFTAVSLGSIPAGAIYRPIWVFFIIRKRGDFYGKTRKAKGIDSGQEDS